MQESFDAAICAQRLPCPCQACQQEAWMQGAAQYDEERSEMMQYKMLKPMNEKLMFGVIIKLRM